MIIFEVVNINDAVLETNNSKFLYPNNVYILEDIMIIKCSIMYTIIIGNIDFINFFI